MKETIFETLYGRINPDSPSIGLDKETTAALNEAVTQGHTTEEEYKQAQEEQEMSVQMASLHSICADLKRQRGELEEANAQLTLKNKALTTEVEKLKEKLGMKEYEDAAVEEVVDKAHKIVDSAE